MANMALAGFAFLSYSLYLAKKKKPSNQSKQASKQTNKQQKH